MKRFQESKEFVKSTKKQKKEKMKQSTSIATIYEQLKKAIRKVKKNRLKALAEEMGYMHPNISAPLWRGLNLQTKWKKMRRQLEKKRKRKKNGRKKNQEMPCRVSCC